jgi:hypothetical protein
MKAKTIITAVLLIFVVGSLAYLVFQESPRRTSVAETDLNPPETPVDELPRSETEEDVEPERLPPVQVGEAPSRPEASEPQRGAPDAHSSSSRIRAREAQTAESTQPAQSAPRLHSESGDSSSASVVSGSETDEVAASRHPAYASMPVQSDSSMSHIKQKVLAYYFHGRFRCATCRKIEALSYAVVHEGFPRALKEGRLEWQAVNIDEPAHKHFVSDYQLYTRSLVLVRMRDGKQVEWKNLERVWELVGDDDAFKKYVLDELAAYLGDSG